MITAGYNRIKLADKHIPERLDELERREALGAYDKRTIIELSGDVIEEITKKYGNVKKGVGGIMRGPLIETEARRLSNERAREDAVRFLKMGKLTVEKLPKVLSLVSQK